MASVRFATGMTLPVGDYFYELEVDDGKLSHISVTVLDFPKDCLPKITQLVNQGAKVNIHIPEDPFRNEITARILALEGALSLWGIKEVQIDEVGIEWIPENDEEKRDLSLFSFSTNRGKNDDDLPEAPLNLIARTIAGVSGFLEHELPLNFFRRGKADLSEGRFIDAILDFYFVLETLFANGKFHKAAVIEEFLKASELLDAIRFVKTNVNDPILCPNDIRTEFIDRINNSPVEEIIKKLVEVRGFLHHHTLKREGIWHPANQKDYRLDCLVLVNICQYVMSHRVLGHLFDDKVFDDFKNIEVHTSDGIVINWSYPEDQDESDTVTDL